MQCNFFIAFLLNCCIVPGYEPVKLPEDSVLSGFTPLLYTAQEAVYAPKELETSRAQFSLRLSKLLFFGTVYLCGVDPPVLKLEIEDGFREYVSVVCLPNSRDSPPTPDELVGQAIYCNCFFLIMSRIFL